MKKILTGMPIIAFAAIAIIGATVSYFTNTEISSGNQFITGTLGLQVGDSDPTTWNFTKENIMPGDSGKEGVELLNNEIMGGDLNISFANLSDEENVCHEPEYADEPDCGSDNLGELGKYMDILAYLDENNNGNYDPEADTFIYQGKANGILGGGLSSYFLPSGAAEYFMLEWNLGFSVLNMAQSDKIVFDIVFVLNQADTPDPTSVCGNGAIEGIEQCDDGNTNSGDGCSSVCQNEPMLTIGSQSASYGQSISVPIIAANAFSNVGSVTLYINYDSSLLSYLNPGFTLVKLPPSTIAQSGNKITVLWYDYTGTNPISFDSGDVLMHLNFNVSAGPGTANLMFSPSSIIGDNLGNKIPAVFANGAIAIN